jgi:hypothetical protein
LPRLNGLRGKGAVPHTVVRARFWPLAQRLTAHVPHASPTRPPHLFSFELQSGDGLAISSSLPPMFRQHAQPSEPVRDHQRAYLFR